MTQPPDGGLNRPSPQEPTDPLRAAQPEPGTTAAGTADGSPDAAAGQPAPPIPASRPAPPVAPVSGSSEESVPSRERPDSAEGTVEFGQAGFPTPPGYPAYGQPAPSQPARPPVTASPFGGAPAQPPAASPRDSGPGTGTVEFGQAGFPIPPGYPAYGQQPPTTGFGSPPPSGYGPQPAPDYGPPPAPAPDPRPAPPGRRRGVLIASIVLAMALLLCGGGGLGAFLLLRDEGGEGAPEPVVAADGFLRAVYLDQDATKANGLVCSAARDRAKIAKKVDEVRSYRETYKNPRFRWTPPEVTEQTAERAVVSTKLTMITGDERFSEQELTLTVVRQNGWWVCEVA